MRCIKMGQWSDCGRLLVKEARGGKFLSGKGQIGWEDGKGLKRVGWGQFVLRSAAARVMTAVMALLPSTSRCSHSNTLPLADEAWLWVWRHG